jgi:hypothetical protein
MKTPSFIGFSACHTRMKRWISLPHQNLAALLVILLSWTILSSAVAVLKLYWEFISDPAWREWGFSFMEWMAADWILIITRATLVGIGIGIVHYFLARALCRKEKHPIRIREVIKVVATAIILCACPAFYLRKELKSIQMFKMPFAEWRKPAEFTSERSAKRVLTKTGTKY